MTIERGRRALQIAAVAEETLRHGRLSDEHLAWVRSEFETAPEEREARHAAPVRPREPAGLTTPRRSGVAPSDPKSEKVTREVTRPPRRRVASAASESIKALLFKMVTG
jgi:hypothetical protein